ncbi:MAG TPA: sigma-70 family RNA polymerase sigma factor [Bacteroidales bacterium]|nr:sigma-70 family RNA polymerase sigma factor [Bacteroidales bacterium]
MPEIVYLSVHYKSEVRNLFGKISDKDIVEGIRKQDDKVLKYLYNTYYQTIKNHVLKNSGSADDVSDVFQETIIALYQKITDNNFHLTSDLKGYFFGVARNIWSAELRARKKTEEIKSDYADEVNEDYQDPVFQRIMARAFARLKPDCRMVLTLFYDGCPYDEIASRMKLKNETYARRKKYLCKEALMELIKQDPEYRSYLRFQK